MSTAQLRTTPTAAARTFASLTPDERAKYDRAARASIESELTLHEYALESGFDEKLLWRARAELEGGAGVSVAAIDLDAEDLDAEITRLLRENVPHRDIAARLETSCTEVTRVRKQLGWGRTGFKRTPRVEEPPPPRPSPPVYPLPVIHQPADTFRCGKYACTLTARACVIRQGAVVRDWVGNRPLATTGKNAKQVGKPTLFNGYCASGECAQGKAVAAALEGQTVEPPRKMDFAAQWRGKRKLQAATEPHRRGASRLEPRGLPAAEIEAMDEEIAEWAISQPRHDSDEVAAAVEAIRAIRARKPASPAKEKQMPPPSPIKNVSDADFRKAFEDEGGSIIGLARRFGAASKTVRKRVVELGLPIADPHSHRPTTAEPKPAAVRPAKAPRVAKPAATNSDPDQAADEFERMRRIVEDFQALSRAGREYVSGRLTSMASVD